ncbi:protein of unknown function [Pseudomonas sp. JV241A]|nr:protein of unknown function [Pseudomonas sp. JV241A]
MWLWDRELLHWAAGWGVLPDAQWQEELSAAVRGCIGCWPHRWQASSHSGFVHVGDLWELDLPAIERAAVAILASSRVKSSRRTAAPTGERYTRNICINPC